MHLIYMALEMIQVLELQHLTLGMVARDLVCAAQFLHMLPVKMITHNRRPAVPERPLLVQLSLIPNIA